MAYFINGTFGERAGLGRVAIADWQSKLSVAGMVLDGLL